MTKVSPREKLVLVLAGCHQQAMGFARTEGLSRLQWRYASSARSIEGISNMRIAKCGTYWLHPEAQEIQKAVDVAIAVAGCEQFVANEGG